MTKFIRLIAVFSILSLSACSLFNSEPVLENTSSIDGSMENASTIPSEIDSAMDIDASDLKTISPLKDDLEEDYIPDAEKNISFMTDVVNIVFFDFDSVELNEESRQVLADQALWLENHPRTEVMIEGHCDERGTREYNLALGAKRAAKTKDYLVALGINESRIQTISYGKERPMILDSTTEAWSKNRRAVTILY